MPKKYKALAEMSTLFAVEFDEADIPAGMDEHDYAQQLAEMGDYREVTHSGEFKIYEVMEITQ